MSVLWTGRALAKACDGALSADFEATGVSIDTRSLKKGELFVALTDQRDGHDFVKAAFAAGAGGALVTHRPRDVPSDAPLVVVPDVLCALERIGRAARARCGAKVIAVTGSVGKTGTKEMLRSMLAPQGKVHAAEKSFNNHWGVPLTLARMPEDTDFAVLELGMNHPGEIGPLSRMVEPDVAIITTVAPVHMLAFKNIRGVAKAKAEIFEGLKPGGVAVINREDKTYPQISRAARKADAEQLRFGWDAGRPEFKIRRCSVSGEKTTVAARLRGKKLTFEIGAPGRHLAMNALAALGAVESTGADVFFAAKTLADWSVPDGRGAQWLVTMGAKSLTLIDESYNANPVSMRAAFDVLRSTQATRRVAILGDMLELGADELALHAQLAASTDGIDVIHCCGPMMQELHKALPVAQKGAWFASSDQATKRIAELVKSGDAVMIKGSLGSRMGQVGEAVKQLGAAKRAREK